MGIWSHLFCADFSPDIPENVPTLDVAELTKLAEKSATTDMVLREVGYERTRQDQKWGEQNHPSGTGSPAFAEDALHAKAVCRRAAARGECTYRLILNEEVQEAFAESDPAKLREELIQVAAVAVQWIEAIDRRAKP